MASKVTANVIQKAFYGMGKIEPRASTIPGYQRNMGEEKEQKSLIEWCDLHTKRYPLLGKVIHIPNGAFSPPGEKGKMVGLGMRPGVWDLQLAYLKLEWEGEVGRSHVQVSTGLLIEMKYGKNGLDKKQKAYGDYMAKQGWHLAVCYSWVAAAAEIMRWLDITDRAMWEGLKK